MYYYLDSAHTLNAMHCAPLIARRHLHETLPRLVAASCRVAAVEQPEPHLGVCHRTMPDPALGIETNIEHP